MQSLKPPLAATQLELTNRCGLDCDECARRHMTRPLGDISWELAVKLADETIEAGAGITPSGLGEPLLWPQLPEFMVHIGDRSPETLLTIYTSMVTPENLYVRFAEAVLHYPGRLLVAITMHYAQGQPRLDTQQSERWGVISSRVLAMRVLDGGKREIHVSALPTVMRQPKLRDRFLLNFGTSPSDRIHVGAPTINDWFGLVADRNPPDIVAKYAPDHREVCGHLSQTLMVLWDGRCTVCCMDVIEPDCVIGNANEQGVMDIWHGEPMMDVRRRHFEGDLCGLAPCCKCRVARCCLERRGMAIDTEAIPA